jgi:hypothetical protein
MKASAFLAVGLGLWLAAGCDQGTKATRDESEASEDDAEERDEDADEDEGKSKKKKAKKSDDEDEDAKDAKPAAATDSPAAATGAASAEAVEAAVAADKPLPTPVTSPELQTYPLEGFAKIPGGCSEAFATAGMAPGTAEDYQFPWVTQAMLATGQYKVVDQHPTAPGQVSFELHQAGEKHNNLQVLVARCFDGSTCNHLVAMLRSTTRSTNAQPFCKKLPLDLGPGTFRGARLQQLGAPLSALPGKDDAVGQCARLQACSVALDPSKAKEVEVGFECQKAPHKVKRECAEKHLCSEVVNCLGN